jgi:hypothetical protein
MTGKSIRSRILIAVGALVVIAGLAVGGWSLWLYIGHHDPGSAYLRRIWNICLNINEYYRDFGTVPGYGDRSISDALRGENPENKQYLMDHVFNEDGLLLDHGSQPVKIDILARVRSAGPNHEFGDEDDLSIAIVLDKNDTKPVMLDRD